jgi:hypothetical protein
MFGRSQIARFLIMPKQTPDAEAALHKLGQRLREGFAAKHPTQEKDIQAVKDAVRGQYEQEQKAEREKTPAPEAEKEPERKPSGPDLEK